MFPGLSRFYNSIKLACDLVTLACAFGFAYLIRFEFIGEANPPPVRDSLIVLGIILIAFPFTFAQASLYTTIRSRSSFTEMRAITKAIAYGTLFLLAAGYFLPVRYSRGTIIVFLGLALVMVIGMRLSLRALMNHLRRRGFGVRNILIIGDPQLAERVVQTAIHHRELGFHVVGLLTDAPAASTTIPIHGDYSALETVLKTLTVHQVILAFPLEEQSHVRSVMQVLERFTVDVKLLPDLFHFMTLRGGLEEFGELPLIRLQGAPFAGWNRVLKRIFDLAVASLSLLVASPFMLLIALLVRLTSRGPVLFRQTRMGVDGHLFEMLKFRTMTVDAEADGARFATSGDPRRTPIGAFLRRLSLDELPQLFNVLKGDMSLVGPRPERPIFIEDFTKRIPRYQLRHMVKSGLTGWAQINGLRGETSIEERIGFDLYYIENWSLSFDVRILLRTIFGGFISKNAY